MSSLQTVNENENTAARANLALIQGDLSKLTEQERLSYYHQVCASVGLNPQTKPLGYLAFQGKLTLYATRNCTDQLRAIHGVSLVAHDIKEANGILTCTVTMRDRNNRTDTDMGCVVVKGLQGDALANAWMKALTKAKRRCTLSLCGLSMLDETETDTMPGAVVVETQPQPVKVLEEKGKKMVENAESRDKALAEFSMLFSKCRESGSLPDDWKTHIRNQYGVTQLKDASLTQLAHLIDWISVYANDFDGEEGDSQK